MRKYRTYILLGITLLVAFVTSILAYSWMHGMAEARAGKGSLSITVAAADLPWGTPLTSAYLKKASYPKDSLPAGYFTDLKQVEGRVLIANIKANEPILDSKLAPTGITAGGVAAVISPNKRAMAVKVDKVKGVSGFIHVGNRVDVLVCMTRVNGYEYKPVTKTVLQNILVLAVGSETESTDKKGKPAQVDVITLEVSPEEAEVLALAAAEGKQLQLALRNYSDKEEVKTRGVTVPGMLSGYGEAEPKAPAVKRTVVKKAAPAPYVQVARTQKVQVIRGNSMNELQFKGDE
jgi:pilus assembly protein CpaB